MQNLKPVSLVPAAGLETITHKATAKQDFLKQAPQSRLSPAEISDVCQVDMLFPLTSYDDYLTSYLLPYLAESELFFPSGFRKKLSQTRLSLRQQAEIHPHAAKKFGRLAALLDKEQQLFDLLQLYRSALVQG
jgi:hypothetical protein